MAMHYVGIDWADQKHDICIMAADGRAVHEFQIEHNLKGFHKLKAYLDPLPEVKINIERSDGLLVDWLSHQPWPVYITPPIITNKRRPRRAKDDRGDAFLLAYLLRVGDRDCRLLDGRGAIVEHLRQLLRAYDTVLRERRRMGNRLIYLLKQYYPAGLKAFSQPYTLIGLAFLERYPTPEAARAVTVDELHDFLREYHYGGRKLDVKLSELYHNLQAPAPHATVQAGLVAHVLILVPMLRHLFYSRRDLEKEILAVFPTHPDAAWWTLFPGSKDLTAARLLAWIGDDRSRFPSASALQAVAGTVPVTRRSGKGRAVEFRSACSHPLRKAVDDLARQSIRHSDWARSYFNSQIARGHSQARAYRALGNRWMNIIWKLWQTGEVYDETIHTANRVRKGQQPKVVSAQLN
jgi:transposase